MNPQTFDEWWRDGHSYLTRESAEAVFAETRALVEEIQKELTQRIRAEALWDAASMIRIMGFSPIVNKEFAAQNLERAAILADKEPKPPKYESIPKKQTGSDRPPDYEIRPLGAGKGTGKICTVHGYYGIDAEAMARRIVEALNESEQ